MCIIKLVASKPDLVHWYTCTYVHKEWVDMHVCIHHLLEEIGHGCAVHASLQVRRTHLACTVVHGKFGCTVHACMHAICKEEVKHQMDQTMHIHKGETYIHEGRRSFVTLGLSID